MIVVVLYLILLTMGNVLLAIKGKVALVLSGAQWVTQPDPI